VRPWHRAPLPWPRFMTALRAAFVVALLLILAGLAVTWSAPSSANVTVATTTSARDSGLLDYLLPFFSEETGIGVRYVAVGTGQALDMGRRGDADVVIVHSPIEEAVFLAEGHGLCRSVVMQNEFLVVGPPSDPAGIRGLDNATVALGRILAVRAPFVSRGDNSGTHLLERRIWSWVGYQPTPVAEPWYREAGQGMAATLQIASELEGYTLTDSGTYAVYRTSLRLEIDVKNDPPLQNYYSVIPVNPVIHPGTNVDGAVALAKWLVSPRGQALIAGYEVNGQPIFHPIGQDGC